MPNWGNIILTNAGKALEDAVKAKATNKTINYTKFKIGSGTLPSGGNWETRTDLVAPVMDVPITDAVAQSTGGTLVSAVATNKDLTVGFEMRELGLFATGTDGSEILYGVLVDSNPDYLSAKEGTTVTMVDFSLLVIVDSDLTVTATLSADSLIRRVDLDKHNTDPTAHEDIRQKFNDYATKTGTGATGTWGIDISGNAATATKATQDGNGNIIADTYLNKSGDTVTGTLNVQTQATTDNSTKVANTAFVQSVVSKLVNSAPATLDTLNELATALGNDPNFATTVTNMISQKADKTVVDNIVNVMYPVGIIVEFAKDVDPNATWVGTTWERMSSGRVLVSAGTSDSGTTYTLGKTGGEESHKLTNNEMPLHNHESTTSSEGTHQHAGTTSDSGNHTHALHKGNSGSGGAYFSQGQVYGLNSGTVSPPDVAGNHNHTFITSWAGTHTHTIAVSNTGGGEAHNNMQPYEVVNRWKRTA